MTTVVESQQVEIQHVESGSELAQNQEAALKLWAIDKDAFARSQMTARELGEALSKVKKGMLYGQYTNWLKENGIDRNRANYCTRLVAPKKDEPGVFDGLENNPGLLAQVTKLAEKRGETIPAFALNVLNAYAYQEIKLPEFSNYYGAWVNLQVEKLKRVHELGGDVIHAHNWKERTEERILRLLMCARPARALRAESVALFESVYGVDKLPLLWVLSHSTAFAERHRRGTQSAVVPNGGVGYITAVDVEITLSPTDVGRPDYTEQEEQRRIAVLEAEQNDIEQANIGLYQRKVKFVHGQPVDVPEWAPVYGKKVASALATLKPPAEQVQRCRETSLAKALIESVHKLKEEACKQ
jgi:hypothetical protein